jgi:hypothetical protein
MGKFGGQEEIRDSHDKKVSDPYSYMAPIDILSFYAEIFEAW